MEVIWNIIVTILKMILKKEAREINFSNKFYSIYPNHDLNM